MDLHKKLIKNAKLRQGLETFFSFLPAGFKVRFQYLIKTDRILHLKNPKRFSEKIQWYKVYYRDPLITQCADKYAVREYVKSKGLGFLLNDLYAVYDDADKIDFESLPSSYAMKSNNGSGTNYFVRDSKSEDVEKLRGLAKKWNHKAKSLCGEWIYSEIEPKIIFEKLLTKSENDDLPDYKFFCFNGEPYCLYTMINYTVDHTKGKLGFFDMDYNQMPYKRKDFAGITEKLEKPKNFDKMVEYAKILSKDFPHVRVDFYNIDGTIIFGELTFNTASGYMLFDPDEFDYIMGERFILPQKPKRK